MSERHLSMSAIHDYLGCARQYEQKRELGNREPTTPDLLIGLLFHSGYEAFQTVRMGGEIDGGAPRFESARLAMAGRWEELVTEGRVPVDWHKGRNKNRIDVAPEAIKVLAWRLFLAMAQFRLAQPPPIALEVEFLVPMPGRDNWSVRGFIDEIPHDGRLLIDMKTAGAKWDLYKANTEVQASVYWWALGQGITPPQGATPALREFLDGGWTRVEAFEFHAALKPNRWHTKSADELAAAPVRIQTVRTMRRAAALDDYMRSFLPEIARGIEARHFPPNPSFTRCEDCWESCASGCPVRLAMDESMSTEIEPFRVNLRDTEGVPF